MSAHTPGPWYAPNAGIIAGPITILPGPLGPYEAPVGPLVAECGSAKVVRALRKAGRPVGADVTANARLIAAAPDLLAACKVALQAAVHCGPAGWTIPYVPEPQMIAMLRAAIARTEAGHG